MDISYGAPEITGLTAPVQAAYHPPSGKTVCFARDPATSLLVGVVTGLNQIGVPVVSSIPLASLNRWAVRYNEVSGKLLLLATESNETASPWHGYLKAAEITVVGETLSFGSVQTASLGVIVEAGGVADFLITPAGKIVVSFSAGYPWAGIAVVGTFASGPLSVGSPVTFLADNLSNDDRPALLYDPASGKIILWYETRSLDAEFFLVGTISGNSISFGAVASIDTGRKMRRMEMCLWEGKVVPLIRDTWDFYYATGTISGTSLSFTAPTYLDWGDSPIWPYPTLYHHLRLDAPSGYLCIIDSGYVAIFHPGTTENNVVALPGFTGISDVVYDQQNNRFSLVPEEMISWIKLTEDSPPVVAVFWTNFHGQTEIIA